MEAMSIDGETLWHDIWRENCNAEYELLLDEV